MNQYWVSRETYWIHKFYGAIYDHKFWTRVLWQKEMTEEQEAAFAQSLFQDDENYAKYVPKDILEKYNIQCTQTETS